ncbi:MAG TPA: HEAT repeat domain-containing protein [Verrucomicrobiae bacterium]|jgi:hypothetical protein|nr:HEAT repeat domain-containing protein [Verrucomicrobiae bacterium]
MNKRWFINICLLIIAIGVGVYWVLQTRDPYINGKPLSKWIELANTGSPEPLRETARSVIRNLSTNHVLVLSKWLKEPPISLRQRLTGWLVQHKYIRDRGDPLWINQLSGHRTDPFLAFWALRYLGHDARVIVAQSLIPDLSLKRERERVSAQLALKFIAPESVPLLIECLSSPNPEVRKAAVEVLGDIGSPAIAAVPALKKIIDGSDATAALTAADSVAEIGGEPAIYMPLVLRGLETSKDFTYVNSLLGILSHNYADFQLAAPLLQQIADQTADSKDKNDFMIHQRVSEVMRSMNPGPEMRTPGRGF